ncbi:MAG: ribonuclease HI family protein [Sphingomonadaceae bacterium]
MDTAAFEILTRAAFNGERVAARRLMARHGSSEAEALHQVLTVAAGDAGLAQLLAARALLQQRDSGRRAVREQRQQQQRAARSARLQPQAAPGGWLAWFDGSAHPNPGHIGIGALLCGPQGERVEISRSAGHGSSSEAEYLALTALLEAAVQHAATDLLVHGDSRVVIDDVQAGRRAAKGLEPHRRAVLALLAQLGSVTLRWVPRHRNGAADQLSQQGATQEKTGAVSAETTPVSAA